LLVFLPVSLFFLKGDQRKQVMKDFLF
jgi:hypothetical protein